MAIHLRKDTGTPVERQAFTWKDLVRTPYSKLDDDAFTRVRVILLNAIEAEAVRFSHACARMNGPLQRELARIRRIEQHQQTLTGWLHPADQTPLETTIAFEQTAIEVSAAIALAEPDPYQAATVRFGLLEDLDHMYRFSALMDRVEGKDANNLLQSYTDVLPGRPTSQQHRHANDEVRQSYDRHDAAFITRLHALTLAAIEQKTLEYYTNIGPMFGDPLARQLYAEIASIEEQHVTQYTSLGDPTESWLEQWLVHEATEVYNYWSCAESERNPRIRDVWTRFLEYELGQFQHVARLFEEFERRDAAEIVPETLPEPIRYASHRELVREILRTEGGWSARGPDVVPRERESLETLRYRNTLNAEGSPSDAIAADYKWRIGTELTVIDVGSIRLPELGQEPATENFVAREHIRRSV